MLKMMGVTDTIADDPNDYVSIASRLGQDQHFYKLIKNKMETNFHKLFNDSKCVAALENFYWKIYRKSIL
jgi:predicted O-linked N-acetylglucosamine transferase (SPINDLY family)